MAITEKVEVEEVHRERLSDTELEAQKTDNSAGSLVVSEELRKRRSRIT